MTTDAPANVDTALDGVWTTSVTEDELASSPLLYEPDEVNNQNWGDLTFTFDKGHFTYTQKTRRTAMRAPGHSRSTATPSNGTSPTPSTS